MDANASAGPSRTRVLPKDSKTLYAHWLCCQIRFYYRVFVQFSANPSLSKYSIMELTVFATKAANTAWSLLNTPDPKRNHPWLQDILAMESVLGQEYKEPRCDLEKSGEDQTPSQVGEPPTSATSSHGSDRVAKLAHAGDDAEKRPSEPPDDNFDPDPHQSNIRLPPLAQVYRDHNIDLVELLVKHLGLLHEMYKEYETTKTVDPMKAFVELPRINEDRMNLRQALKAMYPNSHASHENDVAPRIMYDVAVGAELTDSITSCYGSGLADFPVPARDSIALVLGMIETVYFQTSSWPASYQVSGQDGQCRDLHVALALMFSKIAFPSDSYGSTADLAAGLLRDTLKDKRQFHCAEKQNYRFRLYRERQYALHKLKEMS